MNPDDFDLHFFLSPGEKAFLLEFISLSDEKDINIYDFVDLIIKIRSVTLHGNYLEYSSLLFNDDKYTGIISYIRSIYNDVEILKSQDSHIFIDNDRYVDGSEDEPLNKEPLFAEASEECASYGAKEKVYLFVCLDVNNFLRILTAPQIDNDVNCNIHRNFWFPAIEFLSHREEVLYYSVSGGNAFIQFSVHIDAKDAMRILRDLFSDLMEKLENAFKRVMPTYVHYPLSFRASVSGGYVRLGPGNTPPTGLGVWYATKIIGNKDLFDGGEKCSHYSRCEWKSCQEITFSDGSFSNYQPNISVIMDIYSRDFICDGSVYRDAYCENNSCTGLNVPVYRW